MNRLLPYQREIAKEAQDRLERYNMVYLALVMRAGKSYITSYLINENSLIVTVKSGIDGWKKALDHFDMNCKVINYESLHKVDTNKYDYLVLDEASAKISGFPKPSKSRKELNRFIHDDLKVIWLSGTPSIETSAQLFWQLSASPYHSFSEYKNFYEWYFGSAHYKNNTKGLPGYGTGATKHIGYHKEAIDYTSVYDFSYKFEPIMIKLHEIPIINMQIKINPVYVEAPEKIKEVYHTLATKKCISGKYGVYLEPVGSAVLQAKQLQLANGHIIDSNGVTHYISTFKADKIYRNHSDSLVYYKFQADKIQLIEAGFSSDQLYQIDSNCMGVDMSHYDEMVIYSATYSGANFSQVLSRMVNINTSGNKTVHIYITKETIEEEQFKVVMSKKDQNIKFLRS